MQLRHNESSRARRQLLIIRKGSIHTTLKKNLAAAGNIVAAQTLVAPTLAKVAHITLDKIAIKDDKREEEPTLL